MANFTHLKELRDKIGGGGYERAKETRNFAATLSDILESHMEQAHEGLSSTDDLADRLAYLITRVDALEALEPPPPPPQPAITTTSLPNGTVGVAYNETLQASGATLPYTWSLDPGPLPDGLTLSASTEVITGTPTSAGVFPFTARVTDDTEQTDTQALSITVTATPDPDPEPNPDPPNLADPPLFNGDFSTGDRSQWGGAEYGGTFDGTPPLSQRIIVTTGIDGVTPLKGTHFAKIITAPGDQYGGSTGWRTIMRQGEPIPMRNAGYESWWVWAALVPAGYPGDAGIWQAGPEYHQTSGIYPAPFHFFMYGTDMRVDVMGGVDGVSRTVAIDEHFLAGYAKDTWHVFVIRFKHGLKPNGAFALWHGEAGADPNVSPIITLKTGIGTMYAESANPSVAKKNYILWGIYRGQTGTGTVNMKLGNVREYGTEASAMAYANSLLA